MSTIVATAYRGEFKEPTIDDDWEHVNLEEGVSSDRPFDSRENAVALEVLNSQIIEAGVLEKGEENKNPANLRTIDLAEGTAENSTSTQLVKTPSCIDKVKSCFSKCCR